MDKAEYRIKLEQINSLAEAGDFKGAAAVVDTIDWRHVKSVRTLCMVGEIYEANKRYEDSKRVLQYAYKRSSISKTVLYRLAEINIRTGDYDDAKRFYNEFEQLSPHDTSRYILKYKLLRAEGATLDDQIAVLKEYKEREYTERWAYELAKLYMKNGQKQKCIEECDEMILWFAEGKYVTRAMELKMKLRALNDTEKKKYNDRYKAEEKESAEEARQAESMTGEERISKAADIAVDEDEPLVEEKTEKKFSAVDIIRKMDAAADETVSSALGEERTGTVAAMAKVAQKAAATQEAVEKAAKATAAFPRGVAETAETSAEQANAIPEETVTEAAVEVAEEPAVKAAEEVKAVEKAIVEEVAVEPVKEPAEEPVEVAKAAETIVEETVAQAVEEPVAEVKAAEAVAEKSADFAGEAVDHANLIAEQASADLAEAAAWKAAAIEESAAETSRKSAAIKAAEKEAAEEAAAARAKAAELARQFKEQAGAEAAEEAAWRAAMTEEAAAGTVQEATAIEDLTENDFEKMTAASGEAVDYVREFAVQANDEAAEAAAWKAAAAANATAKSARKAAIEDAEGAAMAVAAEEAAWIAATKAAAESINKSAGAAAESDEEIAAASVNEAVIETRTAESEDDAAEVAVSVTAEETAAEAVAEDSDTAEDTVAEEVDTLEEPAPISPEELARSADEEAERALQEMMASFLNEFAVSGDEYKMTTDIIPDEEDVPEKAPAPQPRENQNDPERMLGKETDESLGLTRTESFQEQLKKALEEGGNYEEASQIVIPDDLESPEDAAKRTVMTAHGLEYDPDGNASEEGEENTEAEDADSEVNADAESADAETPDTDSESNAGAEAADADSESNAEGPDADGESNADAEGTDANNEADAESAGAEATDDTAAAGEEADGDESGVTGENDEESAEGGQESDEEAAESEEVPEPEPVKPEPKIMERVAVLPRKFTEEERELFSYFADIPGISEQASLALADIHNNAGDKTSRSGNVLIMGRQLSGKTRLADALICAACLDLNIEAAKVAKIIGEDLNDKDPAEVVDRMSGGFLLIEGAGSMSDEFVEGLNKAMEFRTDDLVVILEDEKGDLMNMLAKHVEFAGKFTSRIIIPVLTNDELVTFARTYANEKGYKLDEMGTLALYTMIGEHQTDNEPVVIGQVKKMVDKAIERSKGPKIAALFRKNTATEDGRTWLKEKDFRF